MRDTSKLSASGKRRTRHDLRRSPIRCNQLGRRPWCGVVLQNSNAGCRIPYEAILDRPLKLRDRFGQSRAISDAYETLMPRYLLPTSSPTWRLPSERPRCHAPAKLVDPLAYSARRMRLPIEMQSSTQAKPWSCALVILTPAQLLKSGCRAARAVRTDVAEEIVVGAVDLRVDIRNLVCSRNTDTDATELINPRTL